MLGLRLWLLLATEKRADLLQRSLCPREALGSWLPVPMPLSATLLTNFSGQRQSCDTPPAGRSP